MGRWGEGARQRMRSSHSTAHDLRRTIYLLMLLVVGCAPTVPPAPTSAHSAQWFKGNLHTHSLWSDGDDYPEMIVRWYREAGYDFLAISDHNTVMADEKWIAVPDSGKGRHAFDAYAAAFGDDWIVTRELGDRLEVRLRTYDEFQPLLLEPNEFLLIRSEEISDGYDGKPIHINATNIAEYIAPQGGNSVLEVMQNNVDAVLEQRERTGRDMFPHLNHPNFVYAVTAEDLVALEGEKFFEVYNGHPLVNNHGDHAHPSTEQIWDYVLAHRLTEGRDVMFGLATDDAHHYHEHHANRANPGRGWVMVRADSLQTGAIVSALERGDFYASTGVTLRDVAVTEQAARIEVAPDEGVRYTIQFVGTLAGFDSAGDSTAVANRIGVVLSESEGTSATYRMTGDELYVRARVISSRRKQDGQHPDEREMAWTQPVQPAR